MMNKRPFISVIIPVYNGEKFLPGCLEALVSGSYRDYELIVVDDCSTDRSVEISREKGAQVLKTSRQSGPGGARNLGAQHARGEVLFFVDADVVVKHDRLNESRQTSRTTLKLHPCLVPTTTNRQRRISFRSTRISSTVLFTSRHVLKLKLSGPAAARFGVTVSRC